MELKQIEYDYENANISYALQQLNTEKSITDQFYSVYMAQSNLEISREELVNAQQSYDIIKNKVEADLAAKDELFQAELNLATARSSVDESQVNLENAKDKLKQTLGMRLDEDILVFAEVEIKPIQVNLDQAISHGLGSRLELRQREIESKELEFDMIKTKALNEFKGDVIHLFGLIGDNSHLNKSIIIRHRIRGFPSALLSLFSTGVKRKQGLKHKRWLNGLMNSSFKRIKWISS